MADLRHQLIAGGAGEGRQRAPAPSPSRMRVFTISLGLDQINRSGAGRTSIPADWTAVPNGGSVRLAWIQRQ